MRKLKLLFAGFALLGGLSANAQTDVTSMYLTNADFEADEALTGDLYGYGKDGTPYGFQTITGWTSVVTSGDNSNGSFPNSGMAGGVFSYGSSTALKGNNKTAPATNPNGEASGNCFGFFGVWGCGGYYYQTVTLAAGKYTITVPMYNQSGTQANTTYTGFFPTSGTNHTVAVNPAVGEWANQTVTFTLADDTEGQIRIGYQSTGSGSGANPMLFIDCVKIEYTAIVVKDVLQTAITTATSVNARISNSDLTTAISTAQGVYDNGEATQEEVNAAAATLNTAVETAMAAHINNGGDPTLALANADLSSLDGWTVASTSGYNDKGNGLIGTYNVRFSAATVDETHLATEYCLGFEARWSNNFASYNQTTVALPAGVYTLTYDVENVNSATTSASYEDYSFIQVGETKNYSSTTEWMAAKSSWTTHTIRVTLNEPAPITVSFGYGTGSNNFSADNTPAIYVSHLKLAYSSLLDGAKAAWDDAVAAADAARLSYDNISVIGAERMTLDDLVNEEEPTTTEGYNTATKALNAATAAFVAAKPSYDALAAEIAYAKTIGISEDKADGFAAQSEEEFTAATAVANAQDLKVLEYTAMAASYANDVTSLLGTWSQGNYETTSGQGYIGSETYFDKWNGSATDLTSSATVALPAGQYIIRVAGRGEATTTMNLSVKVGEADAVITPFFMNGDTGKGIDTDGATNFSNEGTYSNGNVGRGWQYRYVTFTVADGGEDVTIAINGHLNAGTWQSFYAPMLFCDDATYATVEKIAIVQELRDLLTEADALVTKYVSNNGTGVFQIPADAYSTFSGKVTTAHTYDNDMAIAMATVDQLNAAKAALEGAITTFNATELNAPDAEKIYNIVVSTAEHAKEGNPVIIIPGATSANNPTGYAMNANFESNANLAQAFTFTKVAGNTYKISTILAGENVYLTNGTLNGSAADWKDSQIQATTNAENAMAFNIAASEKAGSFNIYNSTTNSTIACQGGGNIYTEDGNADFTLVETAKPSITINTTAAGWGTVMLPFAVASLPTGVKAYTCDKIEGITLTLDEVDALEANKPYIIEGAWNEVVSGDAQGKALTATEGLLTGTYTTIAAPNGSYILQNQGGKVAFYQVDTSKYTPNVPANRAYLEAPSTARALYFDAATAIKTIEALTSGEAEIYGANGARQNGLKKGVNIIKRGDKTMKVMVK